MPIYNSIEYYNNYLKMYGSLWQYYKDEAGEDMENSKSFSSKVKITGKTLVDGNKKDVEIIESLKYFEMSLINCEVNLILTWSKDCVILILQAKENNKTLCSSCNFTNSR